MENEFFSKRRIAVIGGGLAGMFVAARLCQDGHQVRLFEDQRDGAASQAAAGMFNVITGRFGALTWEADTLLAGIHRFLDAPDFSSLKRFYHFLPIYRPFLDIGEYNQWLGRCADSRYEAYARFQEGPVGNPHVYNPLGGIFITPCGWCDIPGLIEGMRELLSARFDFQWIKEPVREAGLSFSDKKISSDPEPFDDWILCPGAWAAEWDLCKEMKIIPNKGETLVLESDDLDLDFIVSRNGYLLPLGGGRFVAGSTYENRFEHLHPTEAGKAVVLEHIGANVKAPFRILTHRSGLRPTTPDRRPVIGTHPEFNFIHLVGGFGTKGVLLSPWVSEQVRDFFRTGNWCLPDAVRMGRFRR